MTKNDVHECVSNEASEKSEAVFFVVPYTAKVLGGVQFYRNWRWDSCDWRFTSPLQKAQPKRLSSRPLHCILDSGENECRAEEKTWSAFSLSQGVNYDFPSKAEPREIAWTVIHQPGCLHPPEQCVTPGPKEGQKRGDFHLHAQTHISQIYPNTSHLQTSLCPAVKSLQNKLIKISLNFYIKTMKSMFLRCDPTLSNSINNSLSIFHSSHFEFWVCFSTLYYSTVSYLVLLEFLKQNLKT